MYVCMYIYIYMYMYVYIYIYIYIYTYFSLLSYLLYHVSISVNTYFVINKNYESDYEHSRSLFLDIKHLCQIS